MNRSDGEAGSAMSANARSYLAKALNIMEENALARHQVDWTETRREAFSRARAAQNPSDTYGAIRFALRTAGSGHSSFFEPAQAEETLEASPDSSFQGPEGRSLGDRVGHLSLPAVQGSEAAYERYVRLGRTAVAQADRPRACAWIVDLRGNHGGNMWPMLDVAGPILGDGKVGMFVDPDGETYPWTIQDGSPYENGRRHSRGGSAPVANPGAPVAVLTDGMTASSGEAVLVAFRGRPYTRSFGEDTYGVPTGNNGHRLSDGAVLVLTETKDADRTGRSYDAPIPPDEEVRTSGFRSGTYGDDVLRAAKNWLLQQPACR
ncbi:S41 family peptidase [Streptomyces acidiscabies]|uniref:S41 family peptidase n=1 Tax=Streptomyces acidiscabies TaxID=42234 RepID=UPI0038F69DC1